MRVPALRLAVRALQMDARSFPKSMLRVGLVLFLILGLGQAVTTSWFLGAPGLQFFRWAAYINFWFITIMGVSVFSAVITEEKEQMTLGLLQLAGFDSIAILLGKSLGQLCSAMLLLAVQIPFVLLSIALGGVSLHQITDAYVMLLSYLLFVYGVGLLCSVVCRRSGSAARLTATVVVASFVLPPLMVEIVGPPGAPGLGGQLNALFAYLGSLSVWSGLAVVTLTGYDALLLDDIVVAHLIAAAAASVGAWLLFDRFNQQELSASPSRGWMTRRSRESDSRPGAGARAFVWKDFHFTAGGRSAVVARCLAYGAIVAGACVSGSGTDEIAMSLFIWSTLALIVDAGSLASRLFHQEIKWNTLSSVAVCPLPLGGWAYHKVLGCMGMLVPGIACWTAALLLVVASDLPTGAGSMFATMTSYYLANVFLGVHVVAYLSLILKRGAFATGLLTVVLGNVVIGLLFATAQSSPGESLIAVAVVMCLVALIMHPFIGQKLAEVSAK